FRRLPCSCLTGGPMSGAARPDTTPQSMRQSAGEPLFRPEVMAERQTRLLGTVLLEPKLSYGAFAAVAVAPLVATLLLSVFGTYTRKVRVNGWLIPDAGLIRVFAPHAGVVADIGIREGQRVTRDTPLMTISGEVRSDTLGETQRSIVDNLKLRR